jgi:flagellar hook protein FlgE
MSSLSGAMNAALSGLDVSQQAINVIGNNIANVNTTAFKSSAVNVKPQFYITSSSGTAATSNFGGSNPEQTGLGAAVDTTTTDFSTGGLTSTGLDTDMAINGNGFFVVQGQTQQYTRDGSFELNDQNQLVTTTGQFVQGYGADSKGNVNTGTLQNLTVPIGSLAQAQATTSATLQGNLDSGGTVAAGASILNSGPITDITSGTPATPSSTTLLTDVASASDPATPLFTVGQTITVAPQKGGRDLSPTTFTVTATDTLATLQSFYSQAAGIDTNAPATGTETPGVTLGTLTGDPANSARLIITGNTGTANALEISTSDTSTSTGFSVPLVFSDGTDTNGNTSGATGESVNTAFTTYDSLGNPVDINVTATLQSTSNTGSTWSFSASSPQDTNASTFTPGGSGSVLGDGTLTFDNTGKLTSSTGTTVSIARDNTGATTPMDVTLDFSGVTALSSTASSLTSATQNGFPEGTLSTFSVGQDGTITGSFTNGQTQTLGQIAVATFNNDQGLVNNGSNLYSTGPASGQAVIGAPEQNGAGTVQSGELEGSNVDLSTQFTDLITQSTGFTASSRVITTADQLITDLLNTNQ